MESTTLVRLLERIDAGIDAADFGRALNLCLAHFDQVGQDALLRERVAIMLASRGRHKEAVGVWDHVARHWANCGHPMRSLAAINQMKGLRPDVGALLDHFSALYNIQSPYLDGEAGRPAAIAVGEAIDDNPQADDPDTDVDALLDRGFQAAIDTATLSSEPGSLPALPLLSLLPADALRRVLDHLDYEVFAHREAVVEAGCICEDLIWTATADFVVEHDDSTFRLPSATLLGLGSFGPSEAPAKVDVLSRPSSELLRLKQAAVAILDQELGDFYNRLATLRRHGLTEGFMQRHPMFAGLSGEERTTVMRQFTGLSIDEGEELIVEDQPSPGLFLVLDGRVDIVRGEDGWEITIATLQAGDVFGEVGVVSNKQPLAGCKMIRSGHVLFLSREDFNDVADAYPSVAKFAVELANRRIADIEQAVSASDLTQHD